jgi:hypothetical protein
MTCRIETTCPSSMPKAGRVIIQCTVTLIILSNIIESLKIIAA